MSLFFLTPGVASFVPVVSFEHLAQTMVAKMRREEIATLEYEDAPRSKYGRRLAAQAKSGANGWKGVT